MGITLEVTATCDDEDGCDQAVTVTHANEWGVSGALQSAGWTEKGTYVRCPRHSREHAATLREERRRRKSRATFVRAAKIRSAAEWDAANPPKEVT